MTNEPTHPSSRQDEIARIEDELAKHCMIFCEVYEEDLKMIQAYLDQVDAMCEAKFQTAYSHWCKMLCDMRQGVDTLGKHHELDDIVTFQESLRAFSFASTVRFLRDIGNICGVKLDRQWVDRFQAHVLLILQAHQEITYKQRYS